MTSMCGYVGAKNFDFCDEQLAKKAVRISLIMRVTPEDSLGSSATVGVSDLLALHIYSLLIATNRD
jgi:hypothetical protein